MMDVRGLVLDAIVSIIVLIGLWFAGIAWVYLIGVVAMVALGLWDPENTDGIADTLARSFLVGLIWPGFMKYVISGDWR